MSISLQDNLDILNKKQNVKRDAFKTIEEMKAFPSTSLPPVFHAMCEDDGCLYIYNVNNSENDTTGKWRKFECSTNGTGGTNGKDGVSPTVSITTTDTGHTVKITDVNGVNSFDVLNGKDGVNGTNGQDGTDGIGITKIEKTKTEGLVDTYTITFSDDSTFEYTVTNGTNGTNGVSPNVTITEIDGGHTITITDADGTQSFNVLNGADGYSPSAKVEKENGVVTITITDKTGTTTAEIKENAGGAGEENVIEEIKVNGVALTPDENKSVDITVPTVDVDKDYVDTELAKKANIADIPTKVSELQNDSKYQTDADVDNKLASKADKTEIPAFINKTVLDGITSEKVADWDEAVTTKTALEAHTNSIVSSKTGVHGMRYFNGTLQVQNEDNEWIDIETGGSGGDSDIAPNNVSDINLKTGNTKLTITWSDPSDTIIEGQTLSTWKGTKLVQKVGSFPANPKDGTLILDNQTRDKYKTSGFEITGLTNGETYYFALFPYSDTGAVNTNVANRVSGTPQAYRKMTAIIDLSNSNPATSVTYADDAVGMTAKSSDWDDFFGHYPVLFKDGTEVGKLNPNNFTQFEDGSPADISSGEAGDVMIAFPRRGLTIKTVETKIYVSMTDDPDNSEFEYNAHTRGTTRKEVFYLGAYKGYVASSKLRSLSGKAPTASQTIGTFRTQAHANGTGYEQSGFYQLIFRQCMYLLKYKNLDSQSALGQGYVGGSAAVNTGATNTSGMDYGTTSNTTQMKLFGLEDFWGNIWEWIDGIVTNSTRNILTATDSFNDSGLGYKKQGQGASSNIGNYMSKPQGTTETGFVLKEVNGSQSTYFCDYAILYDSCVAFFGGSWSVGADAGAFPLYVSKTASTSFGYVAARLMFL